MKTLVKPYALAAIVLLGLFFGLGGYAGQAADDGPRTTDSDVTAMLRRFLASSEADVRISALQWIARDPRTQDDSLIPAIFDTLKDSNGAVRNKALANMGWIFERRSGKQDSAKALAVIQNALKQTSDRPARLVVLDLLRGSAERGEYDEHQKAQSEGMLTSDPTIQRLIASLLSDPRSSLRPEVLGVVKASRVLQAIPSVVDGVAAALHDDSLTVRSDAVDLLLAIEKRGELKQRDQVRPMLLAALQENDPNVQLRISRALGLPIPPRKPVPPALSLSGEKVSTENVPFDFNYFTAFVQPLFVKKYGGAACVQCHVPGANTSGAFRILAPQPDGRYTLDQSRTNFVSVLAAIDRENPGKSKLLLKPLDPRASEGTIRGMIHDGGVFWNTQYDPDFETVQNWLKGAKIETAPDKQLDYAYFVQRVEPIFSTPGPDGFACINCHSTHAILHLESPESRDGKFSVEQLENNYQSAHRVVDEMAPSNSFIVRKPTSLREGEPGGLSHAGGIRWPDKKDSWQYKTLITWMGMKNLAGQ
ncbi:MAG: HEAT repeat domain-containing protein [Terriglobia bacterium]